MKAFENDKFYNRLLAVLDTWKNVPYRHMGQNRRGTDCTLFIACVFQELGILTIPKIDYYPKDWFVHTKDEIVLDSYLKAGAENLRPGFASRVFKGKSVKPFRGDVLCFSMSKTGVTNHSAIWLGTNFIHCLNRRGVCVSPYKEKVWRRALTHIFRVYKEAT
jgi:cell wall-associated NlpC family hydrolase